MFLKVLIALAILSAVFIFMMIVAMLQNDLQWRSEPGPAARLISYLSLNDRQTAMSPEYPELMTRSYPLTGDQMRQTVIDAFARLNWELIESGETTVHAVVTTRLFKYKDDVYVTVEAVSADESSLQVRSVSRVGRGDLGTNIRHILDLYTEVESLLQN